MAKIISKKDNHTWKWFDQESNKFLRPISSQDQSFRTLPPKIKAEIRQQETTLSTKGYEKNSPVNQKWRDLNKYLKSKIAGQDKIINQWCKNLSSKEFNNWRQPVVGLFMGPTGVGKTLLAKETNNFLYGSENNDNFHRFDCNSPKLQNINLNNQNIEDLCKFVKNHPKGIILCDEFEKLAQAGNAVLFTSFLNIIDEGYLTDQSGAKIDCSGTTLIFTTNIGSQQLLMNDKHGAKQQLQEYFSPEMLGRLDSSIFYFNSLKYKDLINVTKLLLNGENGLFFNQLDMHKIICNIDDDSLKNIILNAVGVYHSISKHDDFDDYINLKSSDKMINQVALHESGHAIVALAQMSPEDQKNKNYPVKKITAVQSGDAGGYTLSFDSEENIPTKEDLLQEINELYAGRIAEKLFVGESKITTGWSSDKTRINKLIQQVLLNFDPEFSEYVDLENDFTETYMSNMTDDQKEHFSKKTKEIEAQCEKATAAILTAHQRDVKLMAEGLKIKSFLTQDEVAYIWDNKKLPNSVLDFKNKSKEEKELEKLGNVHEPISNKSGARGVRNYIQNDLAYQFEELYDRGEIKDNSTVQLKVNKDGILSLQKDKKLSPQNKEK